MLKQSFLLMLLLSACSQSVPPGLSANISSPNILPPQEALPVSNFDEWKQQFSQRALREGHPQDLVFSLLQQMTYQEKTVRADKKQPEAAPMIWHYLDRTVTAERIAAGKKQLAAQQKRFAVPLEYVMAIWGMESGYGQNMGKHDLAATLATLAYDGRRREFAEQQLLALLTLLQRGELQWSQLQGSWAGGMGHTQFIPTTFLQYGVDGNGDGLRSPFQLDDALASTAHYLSASGWQKGHWGEVVDLPPQFDFRYLEQQLDAKTLNQLGILRRNGQPVQQAGRLWLPAGQQGSAFLLYPNFDVIKVYNRSDSYALAVGLLADAIAGRNSTLQFPRSEKGLTPPEIKALQNALNAQGFDAGSADGLIGTKTRQAFHAWQQVQGRVADGFISQNSVRGLL